MRRLLVISCVIVCSLLFVLAQERFSASVAVQGLSQQDQGRGNEDRDDHDDHDDKGPIQVGYAVITPLPSSNHGLVVFETFGLRHGSETPQAGVLPTDLTTNAVLFVDSDGRLSKDLGVAITNPNSSNVNVTLTLRNAAGTTLGSTTITVPSHQQTAKFVTELFANHSSVPKDVTGMLSITSTSPVSVVGLRFRGANFSTLPVTSLSTSTDPVPTFSEGVGGAGAILLPQFAAGGGWATEIVIANTGTTSLTVRVDLFKQNGTPLSTSLNKQTGSSFTNLVIPAGGVLTLAPRDKDGDDDF